MRVLRDIIEGKDAAPPQMMGPVVEASKILSANGWKHQGGWIFTRENSRCALYMDHDSVTVWVNLIHPGLSEPLTRSQRILRPTGDQVVEVILICEDMMKRIVEFSRHEADRRKLPINSIDVQRIGNFMVYFGETYDSRNAKLYSMDDVESFEKGLTESEDRSGFVEVISEFFTILSANGWVKGKRDSIRGHLWSNQELGLSMFARAFSNTTGWNVPYIDIEMLGSFNGTKWSRKSGLMSDSGEGMMVHLLEGPVSEIMLDMEVLKCLGPLGEKVSMVVPDHVGTGAVKVWFGRDRKYKHMDGIFLEKNENSIYVSRYAGGDPVLVADAKRLGTKLQGYLDSEVERSRISKVRRVRRRPRRL